MEILSVQKTQDASFNATNTENQEIFYDTKNQKQKSELN